MPDQSTATTTLTKIERPPIDDALIRDIADRIAKAFNPRRIVLFGSRARGDYHEDSDVDIFVEMESDEKRWQRRVRIDSIFRERWWPMDLLVYTPEEVRIRQHSGISLIPEIEREGRILYESSVRA